ncbi:polyprenyl synthetase family protein [Actinacidiphila glaucinigra]|uniref:polyprenyl synthetase family protein n=1 Tax=Actinacidiphila glaucinigra TaxID=235986 RepID=UPI0037120241
MRPTGAIERVPASGRTAVTGTPCGAVDADVAGCVGQELAVLLDEQLTHAACLDDVFARDVARPIAQFTLEGGRRTRARLLWWAMRACGGGSAETASALRMAAAIELIQTCALVQDDVMDGSPQRRGRASFHAQVAEEYRHVTADASRAASFAASAAILAGDLALSWADDIVAATDLPRGSRRQVLEMWRCLRTEMVAGQYLDLHSQVTGSRSVIRALQAARLKTALYSVERPLAFGAVIAGANAATLHGLRCAGRYAGIAFQLRDDLDSVFGDSLLTGKESGEDIKAGKLTYLIAVARARAEAQRNTYVLSVLDSAVGNASLSPSDLRQVRDALADCGARQAVEQRVARLGRRASRHLRALDLDRTASERLAELLHTVMAFEPTARGVQEDDGARPELVASVAHGGGR